MSVPGVAGGVQAVSGGKLEVRGALHLVKLRADIRGLIALNAENTLKTVELLAKGWVGRDSVAHPVSGSFNHG